jgi:hypothetical protein
MFSSRIRALIRQQWAGLIALFLALSGGVAWASHPGGANTINSADIIDGEVKSPDIANAAVVTDKLVQGAVTTGKVKDENLVGGDVADGTLSGADVQAGSLGAQDISGSAFRSDDIRDVGSIFGGKQFGLPDNAVETSEIENNQVTSPDIADGTVTGSDLATSAKPIAYAHEDLGTGGFGDGLPGSTEGSLTLPPGTYAISAKIGVTQFEGGEELEARCRLEARGVLLDESEADHEPSFNKSTLPLQGVHALPSGGGNVEVICSDLGHGDVQGDHLRITAIQVGSIG